MVSFPYSSCLLFSDSQTCSMNPLKWLYLGNHRNCSLIFWMNNLGDISNIRVIFALLVSISLVMNLLLVLAVIRRRNSVQVVYMLTTAFIIPDIIFYSKLIIELVSFHKELYSRVIPVQTTVYIFFKGKLERSSAKLVFEWLGVQSLAVFYPRVSISLCFNSCCHNLPCLHHTFPWLFG
jgi:hypothetical protein